MSSMSAVPAASPKNPRLRRRGRIDVGQSSKKSVRAASDHPPAQPKKATPKISPAPPSKPAIKPGKPASTRTSALDAAAHVLADLPASEAASGLSAPELIERMHRDGLWTSPSGRTPSATLYAAMIREIASRKDASRFTRVAPGRFAAMSAKAKLAQKTKKEAA